MLFPTYKIDHLINETGVTIKNLAENSWKINSLSTTFIFFN